MRKSKWTFENIESLLAVEKYTSVKECRMEHWASHLAAQRAGLVPHFAQQFGLDYAIKKADAKRLTPAFATRCLVRGEEERY